MSRRTKAVLVAIVLAVSFAVYAYVTVFRIHGFIVALEPIDRDRAIVCVRANDEYGQPPRAWVGLVDAKRGVVWSTKLTGLPIVARRDGLLVDQGLAIVRTALDGKKGLTAAYAIDDGEKKWETRFDGDHATATVDLVAAGPQVVQGLSTGGRESFLSALDPRTGRVAWTFLLPEHTESVRPHDGALFVQGLFRATTAVEPVDGAPTGVLGTAGALCFEKEEHVHLDRTSEGTRVVARKRSGERRIVVANVELPERSSRVLRCGRYGERLVLAIALTPTKESESDVGLLEIDPAAGTQVSFVELGLRALDVARVHQAVMDDAFPEHAVLNGTIPRFVPLLVRAQPDGEQFAVLDMQERRIVRRGPRSAQFGPVHVIHVGDVYYLQEQAITTGTLARFDGKTGAITAAVVLPSPADVKAFHVRDGRVWVYRDLWLDSLPYAALDAETLRPLVSSGDMPVGDVLVATKASWLQD